MENEVRWHGAPRRARPAWIALAAIVLFAAVVRWHFFVGFGVTGDDLIYAGMSKELARNGSKDEM